jgi:amino acid transporter
MSPWDGFIYNFLTMGIIFPWLHTQGPGNFPGANLELAIFLALVIQLPIAFAYCCLGTVLPVSGGDYIYQTRAFGKIGAIAVIAGFVIWILEWIAISGNLFATLGLAPLLFSLGFSLNSSLFTNWGVHVSGAPGILVVSLLLSLLTTFLLSFGMRLYAVIQKWLFLFTLAGVAAVIAVFYSHASTFDRDLTRFVQTLVDQVPQSFPGLTGKAVASSGILGFLLSGGQPVGFSLLHTLAVVPIAWNSLQWSTYSVEQNTEIRDADRFRTQAWMQIGSSAFFAAVLILFTHAERSNVKPELLHAISNAYVNHASTEANHLIDILQPAPNVLAMAVSGSLLVNIIIAAGFLANAFQITCNCFIGMTRILVAMSKDGVMPRRLGLGSIERRNRSPNAALWFYFSLSIPVIALNYFTVWSDGATVGVTIACGVVFTLTCLSTSRIPTAQMRNFWMCSDIYSFSGGLLKAVGYVGAALGVLVIVLYLRVPGLRVQADLPRRLMIGSLLLSLAIAWVISRYAERKSPGIARKLRQTPDEASEFYD